VRRRRIARPLSTAAAGGVNGAASVILADVMVGSEGRTRRVRSALGVGFERSAN
jgi:hypothetical protein